MVDIMSALNMIFVPMNLLGLFFGVLVGIAFGCMPGLSVNMGLALLFPLAFTFHGIGGILMLLGIYCGAIYGGSISAILLKTPGTPASVATTLDGYPMATKLGQPGRALGLSTLASTFGGIFSTICLILLAPQLAKVALQFSKPEYFALAIFGLSIITSVSSSHTPRMESGATTSTRLTLPYWYIHPAMAMLTIVLPVPISINKAVPRLLRRSSNTPNLSQAKANAFF